MDTEKLLSEAKVRFNHNAAKQYLKEKYESKLIVADQNGLWKADVQTLNFLSSSFYEEVILVDTFGNPVKVNRKLLSQLARMSMVCVKVNGNSIIQMESLITHKYIPRVFLMVFVKLI